MLIQCTGTMNFRPSTAPRHPRGASAFTLIELLVTMTIIIVLVAAAMLGFRKVQASAAKANDARQMNQIGAAVLLWASENNFGEPMFVANGSVDNPDESLPGFKPDKAPGNPAKALYDPAAPGASYLTSHAVFFSPLVSVGVPGVDTYDPAVTGGGRYWGTYTWRHPYTTAASLTARQRSGLGPSVINSRPTKVGREADNRLLMHTAYLATRYDRKHFNALFTDGSVRNVANSQQELDMWMAGEEE